MAKGGEEGKEGRRNGEKRGRRDKKEWGPEKGKDAEVVN